MVRGRAARATQWRQASLWLYLAGQCRSAAAPLGDTASRLILDYLFQERFLNYDCQQRPKEGPAEAPAGMVVAGRRAVGVVAVCFDYFKAHC